MVKYLSRKSLPQVPQVSPSWIAIIVTLFCPPLSVLLLLLRIRSWFKRKTILAYHEIDKVVGDKSYIGLKNLARTLDMDEDILKIRLKNMIAEGYLGEKAFLDMSTRCLVLDPDERTSTADVKTQKSGGNARSEALEVLMGQLREQMYKVEGYKRETVQKPTVDEQPVEEKPVEVKHAEPKHARSDDSFEKKLQEIRDLNDRIADEEVSGKIDRIGELTASIFRFAQERPDRQDEIRKFLNYYLPTTFKLLESYALLEKQSYQGENIQSARKEIEKILDSLVIAFEQQLDQLFQADAMDISSDIEVLETMIAKDGLREKKGLQLGK